MARIDVIGPDGKDYTLDVAEWSKAKNEGFRLAKPTGKPESAARGAAQGLSLGWGDEIAGHARAAMSAPADWLYEKLNPQDPTTSPDYWDTYKKGRDEERVRNLVAEESHPGLYGATEFAGSLVPALASGAGLPAALASGAVSGMGRSEADSFGELAKDGAIGAGFGLGGYGVGKTISSIGRRVANKAAATASNAQTKAAQLATEAKTAPVRAVEGAYGGLRQTENKAILALLGLEEKGIISPQNAQKLAALKASGRLDQALNEAAANDIEFLGTRIGEVSAKKAEAQAARAALPQEIADETARLLSGKEAMNQILARVKRYGWPMFGSAVGSALGGPVGAAVGALGGAGMRPAMRSWMNMTRHPSVAPKLFGAIDNVASGVASFAPAGSLAGATLLAPSTGAQIPRLSAASESPVPSAMQLAQMDPEFGNAYARGGPSAAAAAFYSAAQTRPGQVLSWLNSP